MATTKETQLDVVGEEYLALEDRITEATNHEIRSKNKRGANITELVKFIRDAADAADEADEASDLVFGRLVNKEQKKGKGRSQKSLPSCVELQKWSHLENLEIPELDVDEIHLLIGQDCADLLLPDEIKKAHSGELLLLWKLEGVNSEAPGMSQSDIKTLETWDARKTIVDNHYTLAIPFKAERPYLADYRNMAEKRLRMLGKRMNKDNNLKDKYTEEIHKLLKKGYAVAVPPEDLNRADERTIQRRCQRHLKLHLRSPTSKPILTRKMRVSRLKFCNEI
ncbi:hypothetical protein O3P69_009464 [Scylla paramamosain]|uniref:Uncharacterized protein n=1 Tax=Scylla paramamosain TaxID=85552 RepID=A0AAW0SVB1_SCYPA